MLSIGKTWVGTVLSLDFSGTISEEDTILDSIDEDAQEIHIQARHVARINSVGVKNWTQSFAKLREKGVQLKFFELSSALVLQLSFVMNFLPLREIMSICLDYHCDGCQADLIHVMGIKDLRLSGGQPDLVNCPHCGTAMSFEQDVTEYFSFIRWPG